MPRIAIHVEGGFASLPGLAKDTVLDTDHLPPQTRQRLLALMASAQLQDDPQRLAATPPGSADLRTYVITVEEGGHSQRIDVAEPIEHPAVRELVEFLMSHRQ